MSPDSRRIHPARPTRADWLAARAALASRRSRRFAAFALGIFVLTAGAFIATGTGRPRPVIAPPAVDTLPLRLALDAAEGALARADTTLVATLQAADGLEALAAALPEDQRVRRDSARQAMGVLDQLLDQAERFPLPRSYRLLAASRAMRAVPGVRALVDSLGRLEATRDGLDPTAAETSRRFADLTTAINTLGAALREQAVRRRAEMQRAVDGLAGAVAGAPGDSGEARAVRDRARAGRDSLARALDSVRRAALVRDSALVARRTVATSRVPPTAPLVGALVLALAVGFGITLATEVGRPTVAHPREAEHAAHVPVLAVVTPTAAPRSRVTRDVASTALDPFRMLYLGLTATGTRTGSVVLTGDDPRVIGAVAVRLAAAAAADSRVTLVVDADPASPVVSGLYRLPLEPGCAEAVAGVQLWRDVARLVVASDAGKVEAVPPGSPRRPVPDEAQRLQARAEFARFRAEYDLTIVAAPGRSALTALHEGILPTPTVVLCATVGETPLTAIQERASWLDPFAAFHGVVLWDAPIGNTMEPV